MIHLLPSLTVLLLASEEGGNPTPFAGTIYQSIAAVVVFLALLYILKAKAWGPILKGLQDRENKIKGDLQRAEAAAAEANKTLEEYRRQLADAQQEVAKLMAQGRAEAQRQAAAISEQAHAEGQELRKRTAGEIHFAKESALAEIYAQAAQVSTQIAGRILGREIKPDDHRRLVDESLAQLKKESN